MLEISSKEEAFDLAEELYSISLPSADAELKFGMDEMNKTHEFWSK